MRAMILPRLVSLDESQTPLEMVELPVPELAGGEVLLVEKSI